jgi:carboxylesterase type B
VDHPAFDPELGATHGVELPLLFGTFASAPQIAGSGARATATSDALVRTWSAFVRDERLAWSSLRSDGDSEIGVIGGTSEPLTSRPSTAELSGHV